MFLVSAMSAFGGKADIGLTPRNVDALLVNTDPLFNSRRVHLVTLATYHRLPTIYPYRDVEVGGLMSYGSNLADLVHQVGVYSGRILKGERPADLPVLPATKFELVINLQSQPQYNEDDPFLDMAALILSEQRASKNNLRGYFIRHKQKEGFVVQQIESVEYLITEGKAAIARGKQLSHEQYCRALLSAPSLTRTAFNRIDDALRAGERVRETDRASFEKTNLELFYREESSERLIELDDRRRFQRKVILYESIFAAPFNADRMLEQNGLNGKVRLVVGHRDIANVVFHLLGLTPLLRDRIICPDTIIDKSDLRQLVEIVVSNKASVENILGIEVRRDVHIKPIQQLGSVLNLVGLKLERVEAHKDRKRKIYRYRIEASSLEGMKHIVERRNAITPRNFVSAQYGWSDEDLWVTGEGRG